jgi:hypothetical protein
MNGTRRLIGSFNHGSMDNALPQAIGAQASQPGRQVISLSGDGGLAMLLGEPTRPNTVCSDLDRIRDKTGCRRADWSSLLTTSSN